ncbi:MAG: hypothetical protein A2341_26655 [Deltaproteobacteria bacterium RIFOXYB12_FULL_58_9]|nr:MAG: hypothetical protein A2341_26655 [Deltaproteobacteria bacterium RIFOXYB12_FULL_58_9]
MSQMRSTRSAWGIRSAESLVFNAPNPGPLGCFAAKNCDSTPIWGWTQGSRVGLPLFPRRKAGMPDETHEKGLRILKMVAEHGLLLTPEVEDWQARFAVG